MKKLMANQTVALSIGLLLVALLLRLPLLNGSFWLDEAAQALESSRPLSQQLNIAYDFQPPLLHLITHFALYFSNAEWWLRTVGALIPGLVSIWATFKIGQKLLSTKTGFWAAGLMATNSFHIFYSQELRPYALPMMLGTLSWLVLLHWKTPNVKQPFLKRYSPVSLYALYAVLTLLGLYASYLYPFLVISQALYVFIFKRELITTYLFHAVFWVLGFSIWLPSFFEQLRVGGELRSTLPNWETIVSISSAKSLALVAGKFMFGVLDLQFSLLFIAGGLLLLLPMAWGGSMVLFPYTKLQSLTNNLMAFAGKRSQKDTALFKRTILILLCWFIVPLLTAWLVSFFIPVIRPKRVLFLMPAFYLLIVASIESFPHQKIKHMFLAILLGLNLFSSYQYFTQPRLQREDWRQLYQTVTHLYPENSVAVFSFPEPFAPWIWYNQDSYPSIATGTLSINDADLEALEQNYTNYTYVLAFDYLRDLTDPDNQLLTNLEASGYQTMDFIDQTNIGFVRVYAKPQLELSEEE